MKFKRAREEDYSIQLTALIDVVFFLLVFFMLTTSFADSTRQLDVELPEAKAGAAEDKPKVFEIQMSKDNKMLLNGNDVTIAGLPQLLADKGVPNGQKRSVVIRADKALDYGEVVKVMGLCKEAGITDIGVAVQ